jgi:peptidoglycan hydrolase-like protein with peptidoglycan-binding domain
MLNRAGISVGSVDSAYGDKTVNAVKFYQKAVGMSQDGITGKDTYNILKNYKPCTLSSSSSTTWTGLALKEDNSGAAVKSLQT